MKFLCGILETIISFFPNLLLLVALLWNMIHPGCKEKRRKKKEASFLRGSIRLYLDVLNDKLSQNEPGYYLQEVALSDHGPAIGRFEKVTKQNHDALEKFFLGSELLEFEEREKLRTFVRFFKGIPEMTTIIAFNYYKMQLEDLMKVFPKEKPK